MEKQVVGFLGAEAQLSNIGTSFGSCYSSLEARIQRKKWRRGARLTLFWESASEARSPAQRPDSWQMRGVRLTRWKKIGRRVKLAADVVRTRLLFIIFSSDLGNAVFDEMSMWNSWLFVRAEPCIIQLFNWLLDSLNLYILVGWRASREISEFELLHSDERYSIDSNFSQKKVHLRPVSITK
jgi:hypothetical protein